MLIQKSLYWGLEGKISIDADSGPLWCSSKCKISVFMGILVSYFTKASVPSWIVSIKKVLPCTFYVESSWRLIQCKHRRTNISAIQGNSGPEYKIKDWHQNEMSLITKLKTKDLFSFHKSRQSQTQTYKSTLWDHIY